MNGRKEHIRLDTVGAGSSVVGSLESLMRLMKVLGGD